MTAQEIRGSQVSLPRAVIPVDHGIFEPQSGCVASVLISMYIISARPVPDTLIFLQSMGCTLWVATVTTTNFWWDTIKGTRCACVLDFVLVVFVINSRQITHNPATRPPWYPYLSMIYVCILPTGDTWLLPPSRQLLLRCAGVYVNKLLITAQPGPHILIFLCFSYGSSYEESVIATVTRTNDWKRRRVLALSTLWSSPHPTSPSSLCGFSRIAPLLVVPRPPLYSTTLSLGNRDSCSNDRWLLAVVVVSRSLNSTTPTLLLGGSTGSTPLPPVPWSPVISVIWER